MDASEVSGASSGAPLRLSQSPLVRVLTQVRWPELGGFNVDAVAQEVGRGLADEFPLIAKQNENQVILTPDGVHQQTTGVIHRFTSIDDAWSVSLGKTFVALETTAYTDHTDFVNRLKRVLTVLSAVTSIPRWSRIGYRYTNRLVGVDDLAALQDYFLPSVLGGLPAASDNVELVHSISESVYRVGESMLLVRSARLGSGASIDPTLPPVDGDSWVLDLDAFDEATSVQMFSPEVVVKRADELSRIAYAHFLAVIQDRFIERFQ